MKVFLSWSGDLSHKVARILRDWLPSVIQAVRPYVSSEDIDKGTRWSSDIAQELEESTFGIICITRENLTAPWINFEAGALSKTIDKSFVSPFLFRIKRSEVQGPLLQFQSTVYEKEDVAKLVSTINGRLPEEDRLGENQLRKAFDVWWADLQAQLDSLDEPRPKPAPAKEEAKKQEQILEELLELARNQQRLLRSPEDILPPAYLRNALAGMVLDGDSHVLNRDLMRLHKRVYNLGRIVSRPADNLENRLVRIQAAVDDILKMMDDLLGLRRMQPVRAVIVDPPQRSDDSSGVT